MKKGEFMEELFLMLFVLAGLLLWSSFTLWMMWSTMPA